MNLPRAHIGAATSLHLRTIIVFPSVPFCMGTRAQHAAQPKGEGNSPVDQRSEQSPTQISSPGRGKLRCAPKRAGGTRRGSSRIQRGIADVRRGSAAPAGTRNVLYRFGALAQHAAQPKGEGNKSRRPTVRTKSDAEFVPRRRKTAMCAKACRGHSTWAQPHPAGDADVRRGSAA